MRWQACQLPADGGRLELHGAALSATRGGSGPHMEVPRGAAGELSVIAKGPLGDHGRRSDDGERTAARGQVASCDARN